MSAEVVVARGGLVESVHRVHVAVVDADGALVARAGDPGRTAFLRSVAKPFQALPLVEDGVVARWGVTAEELALCCASHSGEAAHVARAASLLERAGAGAEDLACGPHEPFAAEAAAALRARGEAPGRIHNNCSGKHAGMLLLARHHGWPREGYQRAGHPVQRRMAAEVARWTGVDEDRLATGVDGCGVVTFAVPLRAVATAFARLGAAAAAGEAGPAAVVAAMTAHPFMVAGTGRLCTDLMRAAEGSVVAKLGAEGVYCAAVPGRGLGVALKVEDGARRAQDPALVEVLAALGVLDGAALDALARHRTPPVLNTRGEVVGGIVARVDLEPGEDREARDGASRHGAASGGGPGAAAPGGPRDALVRLSAAVATGDAGTLERALREAADRADPVAVEEALLQSHLFLGYPAALNALAAWRGLTGRDGGLPDPADPAGWPERGDRVFRTVYGDQAEALRANVRRLHPDMETWMVTEGYGKVLGRPGLPLPERELCIVAVLVVANAPTQLYSHLRGALAVGVEPAEVEAAVEAAASLAPPGAARVARATWARLLRRREGEG